MMYLLTEDALQGARDIIAEWINEDMIIRALFASNLTYAIIKQKSSFW